MPGFRANLPNWHRHESPKSVRYLLTVTPPFPGERRPSDRLYVTVDAGDCHLVPRIVRQRTADNRAPVFEDFCSTNAHQTPNRQ